MLILTSLIGLILFATLLRLTCISVIYHVAFLIRHLSPLSQTDCIPTLHLVCAFRNPPQGPLGARPKVRNDDVTHIQLSSEPRQCFHNILPASWEIQWIEI